MAKETRKVHISVTSNASKDLNKGTVAAKGLSGSLKGVGASANLATGGIKAMTMALISSGVGVFVVAIGALVAGLGSVISVSARYEKALSGLKAITGASAEDIARLSSEAKALGSTTAFTASEVVGLQTELAKLGFKTDDISNATGDILNLAAALDTDLASAAEFTGGVIRGFGLKTHETARVVDVLAKASSSSGLDFAKMDNSLKLVAPTAKLLGVSLERTVALLGVLSNSMLDGSTGGNGLSKSFIMLHQKGLTLEQGFEKVKNSADPLKTSIELVGIVAGKTFSTLATSGDAVDILTESLNRANGAAKTLADERLNNLTGDVTILKSAWEGFILSIEDGTSGISKVSRALVQFTTSAIGFFKEQVELTVVSWEHMMLGIDGSKQRLGQAWSWFKQMATNLADFALQAKESLADVPFFGDGIDKEQLAADRVAMNERLEKGLADIKRFKEKADEFDKAQDKLEADYYKGKEKRELKRKTDALEAANKVLAPKKKKMLTEEEQKELDAKKEFLAKLKKLEQDTDDTTALEKIQRKRERHLEELKDIKMTTTERAEAVKTIDAIYDAQRDAQIKINNDKRKKVFDDFTKQFNIEAEDPSEKLAQQREAHLLELEQLKLDETEKKEAIKAINAFYDNEEAVLKADDRVLKQEQDLADLETKRMLISQGLDLAIEASGQESKIGQALFKIKQMMALAEMAMQMKTYMVEMTMNAKKAEGKLAMDAVNQSGALSEGMANSAKLGPPFNAIPMAIMAIQSGLMIKNMMKSKKEMKKITGRFGGGSMGGGATAPQAPNFNVIGQTSAGDNMIADTIQGANSRPIRAFVVDKDVTSSQELSRNTETIASIG